MYKITKVALILVLGAGPVRAELIQKPDPAAAEYFAQVSTLASQGDTASQICLGKMYIMGLGVNPDVQKMLYWYKSAADHGDQLGEVEIADAYAWGLGVQRDTKKAVDMLNGLVAKGFAPAAYELGILYSSGNGVAKDQGEALKLYEKAADAGDIDGEIALAVVYHRGLGTKSDDSKSQAWLQKVLEHKFVCAATYLRALPIIIEAYFQSPNGVHDHVGMIGIKFIYKDGRATEISLLRSSDDTEMDAAWLKAVQDAKLPLWPGDYHTDDMSVTFWRR